jgi:hypothetical protein
MTEFVLIVGGSLWIAATMRLGPAAGEDPVTPDGEGADLAGPPHAASRQIRPTTSDIVRMISSSLPAG